MQLFIANGSYQNIDFQYRLPKYRSYRQQNIPIGGQIRISGDLTQDEVDGIIAQHEHYGLIKITDIGRYKFDYIMYAYSIDNPIPQDKIIDLVVHNREVNDRIRLRNFQETAIATNSVLQDNSPVDQLKNLEMSIEELPTRNKDVEIHETIRVTSDVMKGASQDPKKPIVSGGRSLF